MRLPRRVLLGLPLLAGAEAVLGACATVSAKEGVSVNDPQYLCVHKTDTGGGGQGVYWYQNKPASFDQAGIDEIVQAVGAKGTARRRLAFAYTLSYLNNPLETMTADVQRMLALAEATDLPIVLHLDGVNWWGAQPQLWNWWDPSRPGYDPANARNVEWFDWGPEHAVKIGWRNWGSPIRVQPQPNLASPAFLQAQDEHLRALVPIVAQWYGALPAERKCLLGAVVLGWEVSTFVNAYYYPDGNRYLERWPETAEYDPKDGIDASIPLGYAAATALGRTHAGPLTDADMDAIIRSYLAHITGLAYGLGLPRHKLVTHVVIHPGGGTGAGALVPWAQPGWSYYGTRPDDALFAPLGGTPWAAPEFQPWGLSKGLFDGFFERRNCRLVNIFNWESIRGQPAALSALRAALQEPPAALVQAPTDLRATVHGEQATLAWRAAPETHLLTVQWSRSDTPGLDGRLAQPDGSVTLSGGSRHHHLTLPPGEHHWTVLAADAAGNAMAAPIQKVSVG